MIIDTSKAKPIMFNTEMVKAILDGRKTQTRRVIDFCKVDDIYINENGKSVISVDDKIINTITEEYVQSFINKNSKYKIGDILYIKEKCVNESPNGFCFKEDYIEEEWNDKYLIKQYCNKLNARIFLKVTNVRVERLQDISLKDIVKEGITTPIKTLEEVKKQGCQINMNIPTWTNLWNSTAKDGYKWEDNPYVFVYEFGTIKNV